MAVRGGLVCLLVVGCRAQFGVFDLESDADTKLTGTTKDVVPSCFSTPSGFCANGGKSVFTPDGTQSNLIAWYNFDDVHGLDHSGNANHAPAPVPDVGPGHQGKGNSAHFNGADSFKFQHSPSYDNLQTMTVSFWIYLLTDSTENWRVVFRKGDLKPELTPTLLLFPDSRKLHARVSTTDPARNGLDSVGAIPLRRWTHVAVKLNYNSLAIYINGVKDNEGLLTGQVKSNTGRWHLGQDLFLPGTGMYMDNFKVYNVALDTQDIQVEASAALPGFGSEFLRLGCKQCDLNTGIERCAATSQSSVVGGDPQPKTNSGYHLCRKQELMGGGLIVARAMGYTDMSSDQWFMEDQNTDISVEKLALCCLD